MLGLADMLIRCRRAQHDLREIQRLIEQGPVDCVIVDVDVNRRTPLPASPTCWPLPTYLSLSLPMAITPTFRSGTPTARSCESLTPPRQ
jgi:hypothetical protein